MQFLNTAAAAARAAQGYARLNLQKSIPQKSQAVVGKAAAIAFRISAKSGTQNQLFPRPPNIPDPRSFSAKLA